MAETLACVSAIPTTQLTLQTGHLDTGSAIISPGSIPATTAVGVVASSATVTDLETVASLHSEHDIVDSLGLLHALHVIYFHTGASQFTIKFYVESQDVDDHGAFVSVARHLLGASSEAGRVLDFDGSGTPTNLPPGDDFTLEVTWNNGALSSQVSIDLSGITASGSGPFLSEFDNDGQIERSTPPALNPNAFLQSDGPLILLGANLDAGAPAVDAGDIPIVTTAGATSFSATSFEDLSHFAEFQFNLNVLERGHVPHPITLLFFHTDHNEYTIRTYTRSELVDPTGAAIGFPRLLNSTDIVVTFDSLGMRNGGTLASGAFFSVIIPWKNGSSEKYYIVFDPISAKGRTSSICSVATDYCPTDGEKWLPGECGCGISDADLNNNGLPDCKDADLPTALLKPLVVTERRKLVFGLQTFPGTVEYTLRITRNGKTSVHTSDASRFELKDPRPGRWHARYRVKFGSGDNAETSPFSAPAFFQVH